MRHLLNIYDLLDIIGCFVLVFFFNPYFTVMPYAAVIFALIWLFIAFCIDNERLRKAFTTMPIVLSALFIVVLICNRLSGRIEGINTHDIMLLFIIAFSNYYFILEDANRQNRLLKASILYIVLIIVNTFVQFSINPMISRVLSSGSTEIVRQYGSPFTASYFTIYALLTLFAGLITVYKNTRNRAILFLALLIIVFLIKSQYTIAVILSLANIFLVAVYPDSKRQLKSFFVIIFVSICIIFVLTNIQSILVWAIRSLNGNTMSKRLNEVLQIIQKGGLLDHSDSTNRVKYFGFSLKAFSSHPIFGIGFKDNYFMRIIGGHSTFADILGEYGLIGGIPYIGTFVTYYRNIIKKYSQEDAFIYNFIFFNYCLISILNTSEHVNTYILIFLIAPMMAKLKTVRWKIKIYIGSRNAY